MAFENIDGLQPVKPEILLPFLDEMSKHAPWCGKLRIPPHINCTCPAEAAQHEAAYIRERLQNAHEFVRLRWRHLHDCPEIGSHPHAVDIERCNCGLKFALAELSGKS